LAINSKNTSARITITSLSTVCITIDFVSFLAPAHVIRAQLSYLPPHGAVRYHRISLAHRNYWLQMSHTQLYLVKIIAM